ncbi:phage shock protein PspC (stress-responsive transcriptional regulator) [Streptosporangium becharense]|uniref:Phage shock protein PspC (Stress-responsive transcriptional regulator) n=1 Tax=Streptosporangium becharense TaxID=1816182 RepID=A0A7W9MGL0_9ACTN|nr:PspC domain-containing protein [Streptosporangium becharense]MBB2909550.1 phage shock protein PspC (stress-responsive transcriptional regulator) [Streptosporangium becharense]MBB5819493.1 phage shock protein PspC (stress-responsive transcriptional regulator) [Streptosporangium becharense]
MTETGHAQDPASTAADSPPTPLPDEGRGLRRSDEGRMLTGVCAGLGRHTGVDPVLFRVGFAVLVLGSGIGIMLYIAAFLLMRETDGGPGHLEQWTRRDFDSESVLALLTGVFALGLVINISSGGIGTGTVVVGTMFAVALLAAHSRGVDLLALARSLPDRLRRRPAPRAFERAPGPSAAPGPVQAPFAHPAGPFAHAAPPMPPMSPAPPVPGRATGSGIPEPGSVPAPGPSAAPGRPEAGEALTAGRPEAGEALTPERPEAPGPAGGPEVGETPAPGRTPGASPGPFAADAFSATALQDTVSYDPPVLPDTDPPTLVEPGPPTVTEPGPPTVTESYGPAAHRQAGPEPTSPPLPAPGPPVLPGPAAGYGHRAGPGRPYGDPYRAAGPAYDSSGEPFSPYGPYQPLDPRRRQGYRPYSPPYGPPYGSAAPVAPVRTAPRPRPPRSLVGGMTICLAMIVGGIIMAVQSASGPVNMTIAGGAMLVVIGAGLLVTTWFDRGAALVAVGALLSIALVAGSAMGGVPKKFGTYEWHPVEVSEVSDGYSVGVGDGHLDLSELALPPGSRTVVYAAVSVGQISVVLPPTVRAEVDGFTKFGDVKIDHVVEGGADVRHRRILNPEVTPEGEVATIVLNVKAGIGDVEVRRAA